MGEKTIIYYTNNKENPEFEKKIQETILENSLGLPIISISQKPIDFGQNICVGDVGSSYFNQFRQIQIGYKTAKTEYVIDAVADTLYPKDYFAFKPTGNIYRYENGWILWERKGGRFFKNKFMVSTQCSRREFALKELEKYFEGYPEWGKDIKMEKRDYNGIDFEVFNGRIACVSFKTRYNISTKSTVGWGGSVTTLPYWGSVWDLRKKYVPYIFNDNLLHK